MPTDLIYHRLELKDNLERQRPPKIDVQSRKGHNVGEGFDVDI